MQTKRMEKLDSCVRFFIKHPREQAEKWVYKVTITCQNHCHWRFGTLGSPNKPPIKIWLRGQIKQTSHDWQLELRISHKSAFCCV